MDKDSKPKSGKRGWDWILWWRIDPEELQKQAAEYATLKIWQSARGISLFCILFSAAVSTAFVVWGGIGRDALIDAGLMLVLGCFIYFGHRWAMIGAMILWTFEKGYLAIVPLTAGGIPNPVTSIIWWAIYMHAFYLAFRVEQRRRNPLPQSEAAQ